MSYRLPLYRLSSIQSCDNFNFIFNNSKLIDKKIQMKDTLQKLINMDDATKSMKNETNSLRKDPRNVSLVAATTTTNTDGIDGENGKDNNQTSTSSSSIIVEKSIIDPYGDRGYYRGELLQASATTSTYDNNDYDDENIPHGSGTMEYSDGRIYEGKWKDGQWNDDNGKATYPNGDMYNGNFYEDQRHGKGKYIWKDGRIYQGAFSNDHRCGYGIYSWPDNSIYKGEFYSGLRHGKGTYTVRTVNNNKNTIPYIYILFILANRY